jgi:hypothetical protein
MTGKGCMYNLSDFYYIGIGDLWESIKLLKIELKKLKFSVFVWWDPWKAGLKDCLAQLSI